LLLFVYITLSYQVFDRIIINQHASKILFTCVSL